MVVYDLNSPCMTMLPNKADPPLGIDVDTAFALPVTLELFEVIGRWGSKVSELTSTVDHFELPAGPALNVMRQIGRPLSTEYLLGLITAK